MEQTVPMDRLICGDVGYGKTEIAVRAAFKAVQDGKQVAVLVPTTLLAQQHYNTFAERMGQFPVEIRQLSRFQTPKEAEQTLEMVADGTADIVIGTHRLLQTATRFKQLGLVIVDEEQRFGVEHKEHLKTLRASVDVLSMSATPIPRTLEMAITGIREMSTIATPPEERHPVLTFVGAYDDRQVAAAIHRELLRDGQVFYLHNRVESIDRAARRLRELVPEARVAVAHGQMGEDALEKVMVGFWEKEFDVLVCTTIVESGIDIPNANTLIVERADLLGLAQLHQIRGRVGRGRERAYAYFLYPPEKPLTEHAHERLATIAQHTELGAGMYVAMKDLEIRGAGNLLGGEQSGHIEGVGFDLYVRMVGEAVPAFKGEQPGGGGRRQDRPADRRAPAARLHRGGAAAPGDVPQARRGPRRRAAARGGGRDDRPVRRAAGAGAEPGRGGPVPAAGPPVRPDRRLACRASTCGSARCRCPTPSRCGSSATTRTRSTSRPPTRSACPGRAPAGSAASRCATRRCWSGARSCSPMCSATPAARPARGADGARVARPVSSPARVRERVTVMRARRLVAAAIVAALGA